MDLSHIIPRIRHPRRVNAASGVVRARTLAALVLTAGLLSLARPGGAAAQTIPLSPGFNFVCPAVTPAPPLDSALLLELNDAVEQVFSFDEASQSFLYQLELPSGERFGAAIAFQPGRGYILKARGAGTVAFSGTDAPATASLAAVAGFNFAGFPPLTGIPTAAGLLGGHTFLESVFRWNPERGAFDFVLKLENATLFGADFALASGEAYFLRARGGGILHFGLPARAPAISSLSGRTLAPGDTPISGVFVVLLGSGITIHGTATSDAEGRFAFPAVPAGTWVLLAFKSGYEDLSSGDLVLAEGQNLERDLALAPLPANEDTTPPANQDQVLPANVLVSSRGDTVAIGSAMEPGGAVWLAPAGTAAFFESAAMTRADGTATAIVAPLHQGEYRLFVVDAAGNISAPSAASVTVRLAPPGNHDLVFTAPDWKNSGASIPITPPNNLFHTVWFAPAGTTAFAEGATMTRAAGTATAIPAPLWEGAYKLFVIDEIGQVSPASTETLTVDNTPPAVSLADSLGARTAVRNGDVITITASFAEASGIDETDPPKLGNGSPVGAAPMTRISNLSWQSIWYVPAGNDGPIAFSVHARDRAGNANTPATGKTAYTIDNTPPANQNLVLPGDVTVETGGLVQLVSAQEPGGAVWLAPQGTTVFAEGPAMTRADGTATLIAAPSVAGTYRLFVVDAAGNVSPPATSTVTARIPATQAVQILHAVNGAFVGTLPAFRSTEQAVVALYSLPSTSYQMTSRIPSAAPALAPGAEESGSPATAPLLAPAPDADMGPAFATRDRLSRTTERLTAPLAREAFESGAARAPAAPSRSPAVGTQMNFWSLNSLNWPPSSSDWTYVTATCKAVGTRCYLFQDNSSGSYKAYPEAAWPILQAAFDNDIYAQITAAFGEEPRPPRDIDGDARVYILFTHNVNRQSASGYFDSTNELTQAQADTLGGGVYKSNQKEILFMQVPSFSFDWGTDLQHHVCGVMAHEFLHMIVYNQRVMLPGLTYNEEDWVNEGLAQVAQDVAGYGYQHGTLSFVISPFLNSPGAYSLTNFSFSLGQYGMSYLFFRHLVDRGVSTRSLGATTLRGTANVEAASGKPLAELFRDFAIALYTSNTGVSSLPEHNFTSINLRARQADGTSFNGPAFVTTRTSFPNSYYGSLRAGGVNYIRHTGGTGANAEITASGGTAMGVTLVRQ